MLNNDDRLADLAHEIGVMFVNQRYSDLMLERLSIAYKESEEKRLLAEQQLADSERIREELANSIRERKIPLSPRARNGKNPN